MQVCSQVFRTDASLSSVFGIATRLRAGKLGVQISVGERDFSLLQASSFLFNGYPGSFPGGKAAGTRS
jgi:hypothetical protein